MCTYIRIHTDTHHTLKVTAVFRVVKCSVEGRVDRHVKCDWQLCSAATRNPPIIKGPGLLFVDFDLHMKMLINIAVPKEKKRLYAKAA